MDLLIILDIIEFAIDSSSKFIVVASDGVFEVLSNTLVESIVNSYYKANDPQGASARLVDEAAKQWKKTDGQDDITCVVVFFNID